jgi:hypothetical protein
MNSVVFWALTEVPMKIVIFWVLSRSSYEESGILGSGAM